MSGDPDGLSAVRDLLERVGFDASETVLTRTQAEVLVLRQRGYTQEEIAGLLESSRPNVANIEARARDNVAKAEETARLARAIKAPVQVSIPAGTDLYDVPDEVYDASNRADIKVAYSAPELVRRILDDANDVISGRAIDAPLAVSVSEDGEVMIRREDSQSG
jgi:Tfx family DNA-binding protein